MLQQRHDRQPARPLWKTTTGAVMMALFSLLLAASLSREIHHFFHTDAQTPGHHCVATQMAAGHLLECPDVAVLIRPLCQTPSIVCFIDFHRPAAGDIRLMPERAPPSPSA
ncbi:MAG: hypothetical protein N3J91_11540 [Verrucomicrobiae bacterium]|nr:hypothetical protein [Verrucomicrobiae bacterium]